ncbi:MAG: acyl-CoA dehydrogenase family protein, partial [Phycisphaerales bacterium]|nr:acyl-CoA dehydrogenase family protein [Phycisphaerales bacterium]
MGMVLTEEQQLLRDSARDFIEAKSPVTAFRALRDNEDPKGYSPDLWKEMVDLGWAGILIPEEFGGLDFGMQGLGLVLEEAGKTLTASPLVSTVLTCGSALMLGGTQAQKQEFLPKIAAGDVLMSLALEENAHHAPTAISTKAEKSGDGYTISGKKTFVLDGHIADQLI